MRLVTCMSLFFLLQVFVSHINDSFITSTDPIITWAFDWRRRGGWTLYSSEGMHKFSNQRQFVFVTSRSLCWRLTVYTRISLHMCECIFVSFYLCVWVRVSLILCCVEMKLKQKGKVEFSWGKQSSYNNFACYFYYLEEKFSFYLLPSTQHNKIHTNTTIHTCYLYHLTPSARLTFLALNKGYEKETNYQKENERNNLKS